MTQPLLRTTPLVRKYALAREGLFSPRRSLTAVDGVTIELSAGEAYGLVGESGCGKTTVGRMISGALEPTSGEVFVEGEAFASPMSLQRRAAVQVVFQDARGALNPRLSIGRQLTEPLIVHGVSDPALRRARAVKALEEVGIGADVMQRYPHEVSGGQRQRIVLARCLALNPRLLVCDEAVSALDVSVQAHVVNLLSDLMNQRDLGCLFISHDLRVVRHLCARVGVMYLGRLVETGPCDEVLERPRHPYTRALVGSLPANKPGTPRTARRLPGEPPSPLSPPTGCAFHPRCALADARCRQERPPLQKLASGHSVACHKTESIAA